MNCFVSKFARNIQALETSLSEERLFSEMIRDDMWIGCVRLRESSLYLFCDVHVE